MSYQIFQVITLKKYIMKTTLFLFLSLLLWCSFSSFKNDSTRPNGWYYMIDKDHDSLSAEPVVTVKDFSKLKLDSTMDSTTNKMTYRIIGKTSEAKKAAWAEATEKSIGKHLGFLFNGVILTAPYVNCKIESGYFFISTEIEGYDMKLLYEQIRQESGCMEEFGFVDEIGHGESEFIFWLIRGGLIGVCLIIMCLGFFKLRKIKKNM